jgi:RHS repeat-associated protein
VISTLLALPGPSQVGTPQSGAPKVPLAAEPAVSSSTVGRICPDVWTSGAITSGSALYKLFIPAGATAQITGSVDIPKENSNGWQTIFRNPPFLPGQHLLGSGTSGPVYDAGFTAAYVSGDSRDYTVDINQSFAEVVLYRFKVTLSTGPNSTLKCTPMTATETMGGNCAEPNAGGVQDEAADPVNTATGNFHEPFSDFVIPGRGPGLLLDHAYNSLKAGVDGPLGFGWTHSYAQGLTVGGDGTVTIRQEDGAEVNFYPDGSGSYEPPPRVIATLVKNGDDSYTFVRCNRETLAFSPTGQLVSVTDRNGYVTTLAYASGQLATVTDSASRQLQFSWTGSRVTSVADGSTPARTVSFVYNGAGDLTDYTGVDGGVWHFTYDGSHRLLTLRRPSQAGSSSPAVTTNQYDGTGRVTAQTDELGRTTSFDYTSIAGSTKVTDPRGSVTVIGYANLVRTSITRGYGTPQAATWGFETDATLGVIRVTDPNGRVTRASYDANGNRIMTIDPLGHVTRGTYNEFDQPLSMTDATGVTTTLTYDGAGNLLTQSRPLVGTGNTQTTTFTYGDPAHPGDLTSTTDPTGRVFSYTYDSFGNLTSETAPATPENPAGNRTTHAYNTARGLRTSTVAPKGNVSGGSPAAFTTSFGHDAVGNLTSVKDPLWSSANPTAHQVTSHYDADRRLDLTVDGNGNRTGYRYDAAGQLVASLRPDGSVVHRGYDRAGNLAYATDPIGARAADNFSRPDGPVGTAPTGQAWQPISGQAAAVIDGGQLKAAPGSFLQTVVDTGARDTTVRSKVTLSPTAHATEAYMFLKYVDDNNLLYPFVTNNWADRLYLLKRDGGVYTTLAEVPFASTPGASYALEASLTGNQVVVKVDGVEKITHTLSAAETEKFGGATRSGVGYNPWNAEFDKVRWDDFSVQVAPVIDTFTRPDGPVGTGPTGHAWQPVGGFAPGVIEGGQLRAAPGNFLQTVVDTGARDTTVRAKVTLSPTAGSTEAYMFLKYVDDDNVLFPFVTNNWADRLYLLKRDAGVYVTLAEVPFAATPGASYALDGSLTGNQVVVKVDGVTKITHTLTAAETEKFGNATRSGVGHNPWNAEFEKVRWDDFSVGAAVTSYGYDAQDRPTSSTDPLGRVTRVAYDGAGNRTSLVDPSGRTTTFAYDAADQMTSMAYSDPATPDVTGITYDALGRRTAMTDGTGTASLAYDSLGRLTSSSDAGATVGYGYDLAGRLTSLAYPGIGSVTRAYDGAGRLQSVTDWASRATTFGYDANSNLLTETYPNGVLSSFGVDNADQVTSVTHTKGSTLASFTYTHDGAGQLASAVPTGVTQGNETYAYTPLNQLASTDGTGAGYGYDPAGNLTAAPGVTQGFDAANQLRTSTTGGVITTYAYDAQGNRTQKAPAGSGATAYAHDQANRLTAAGTTATYAYGGDGLRASKTVSGATTSFVWDRSGGLPLLLKEGSRAFVYGPGNRPIAQVDGAAVTYLHQDQLGSTRLLTDGAGVVSATYTFSAYGAQTAKTGTAATPLGFAGEYTDAETGFQYLRARHYDPATGQFLSRDALVSVTGDPYGYVAGNPLNATDPAGLCPWCVIPVSALLGAGTDLALQLAGQALSGCGISLSRVNWARVGVSAGLSAGFSALGKVLLWARASRAVAPGAGSRSGSALAKAGGGAEDLASARIGLPRNAGPSRATVPGSGPGGYRVPDFSPFGGTGTIATRGTVVEVKNVASLSSSPQLRDLVTFAQSQGVPLEIFTNAALPRSGQLYNWIQSGQVIISPL